MVELLAGIPKTGATKAWYWLVPSKLPVHVVIQHLLASRSDDVHFSNDDAKVQPVWQRQQRVGEEKGQQCVGRQHQ